MMEQVELRAKADARREVEMAYAAAHAEWFRVWAVAHVWEKANLFDLVRDDLFRPDDFIPRDWASLARHLARLGREAAALGSVALTQMHDVALLGWKIKGAIETRSQLLQLNQLSDAAAVYRQLDNDLIPSLRGRASEAAQLFEDAINQGELGRGGYKMDFNESVIRSETAKRLLVTANQRFGERCKPEWRLRLTKLWNRR